MVIAYLYYDTIGSIMQEKVPNTVKRHSQLDMRLKYNVKSYMRLNVCTEYTNGATTN